MFVMVLDAILTQICLNRKISLHILALEPVERPMPSLSEAQD